MVNQIDIISHTPLHLACISGNYRLVRSLVRAGADIHAKDGNGRTPLDICNEKKNEELIYTLKQTQAGSISFQKFNFFLIFPFLEILFSNQLGVAHHTDGHGSGFNHPFYNFI